MRALAILLLSGLSVASIAACAPTSDYQKNALATCPQLEGYPDCPSQTPIAPVAVTASATR